MARDGTARVSVEVTNSGAVKAAEIVELYIHARVSLPVRPVEELKDFARVELNPGESRTVSFLLTPEKLASYGLDMRRAVPRGEFEVMVGKSSADLLKGNLKVE
jgi:beta-glucosidase